MSASMATQAPAGADPTVGAAPDDAGGSDSDVLVTITSDGQGGFMVYAGDEPEGGDLSEDDANAMGGGAQAGATPSSGGQPADSVGAALKIVMTILQENQSSQGAPGGSQDQFEAGFGASKSPTPAGTGGALAQKY